MAGELASIGRCGSQVSVFHRQVDGMLSPADGKTAADRPLGATQLREGF